MSKFSSLSSENKARGRARDWLAGRLRAAGERVFAADDRTAREHGWEIVPLHGGLSRRYRDPRFDTLARCGRCRGSGQAGRPEGGEGRAEEPFAQAQ